MPALSRRHAIAAGLAAFSGRAWGQETMAGMEMPCPADVDHHVAPVPGPPRKVTISWNETAICTAAVPVAKAKGIFAKYNLDVDYVNFAGATDQLLEAISTGKADGAPGMALRWLKPLSQGFDVKLVAGLHAGCMFLMTAPKNGITKLADLKGKTVGVQAIGGPDHNFFSIRLAEIGIDPQTEVDWRQYPPDLLPIALQRGDIQAFSDGDPFSGLQKKQYGLIEIDNNMNGSWAHTACCVVGLRGSLVRDEPLVARAITQAILEGGAFVACHPDEAAAIFQPYAPHASAADLAAMLRGQGHHHQTLHGNFRDEIALYAEALKRVGVFRPSLDAQKYASRVTQDLFAA